MGTPTQNRVAVGIRKQSPIPSTRPGIHAGEDLGGGEKQKGMGPHTTCHVAAGTPLPPTACQIRGVGVDGRDGGGVRPPARPGPRPRLAPRPGPRRRYGRAAAAAAHFPSVLGICLSRPPPLLARGQRLEGPQCPDSGPLNLIPVCCNVLSLFRFSAQPDHSHCGWFTPRPKSAVAAVRGPPCGGWAPTPSRPPGPPGVARSSASRTPSSPPRPPSPRGQWSPPSPSPSAGRTPGSCGPVRRVWAPSPYPSHLSQKLQNVNQS